jgi:probable HAF family extracellular repeat protein
MKRLNTLRLCAAAVAATLMAALATITDANASPPWRIIDLGAGDNSTANAINESGHVVGRSNNHAFLWRDGRIIDLGDLGSGFSEATDVNNRDEVVGFSGVAGGAVHAFLWRRGIMTDLGVLPGGDNSYARAINDRGDIVGSSAVAPDNGALHAFRWRNGVLTDLGAPPGGQSLGTDISNAGVIVGQSGYVAARWRHGVVQALSGQPNQNSQATAVNESGYVTGMVFPNTHGFLWYRGQFTEIGPPPGVTFLQPFGINDRAQIVGYTDSDPFLWQRGQMTLLPHLVSTSGAYDINNRGQIVGFGSSRPDGLAYHAVLWTR